MTEVYLSEDVAGSSTYQQHFDDLISTTRKYRELLKTSNTGAWEYFPATDHFDCNSTYFSMLGLDMNDLDAADRTLGKTWIKLLHADDRDDAVSHFFNFIKAPEGMYEGVFRMLHASGEYIWICSRGGFINVSNDADKRSFIGTHTDITKQKQAEEDIRRERILLRTLIDNLPDAIYVKDEEGRKIIANRTDVLSIGAACEADVIGKTDLELFNNEIGQRGYDDDMRVLRTGEALQNREEVFYNADGSERWLATFKIPVLDEKGNKHRLLGIGHNITQRKKSDEALYRLNKELSDKSAALAEQAEELKSLNTQLVLQKEQELEQAIAQGKYEIASEVLHDIGNALVGFGSYLNRIIRASEKNNLDGLKNLTAFLRTQQPAIGNAIGADKAAALVSITEGIAKTQGADQQEISASISELLSIVTHIQEILNIQRQLVRNHNNVGDRKPVNLAEVIEDCRSMLFAAFDKKGVKFGVQMKPGKHVIKGDHTKLMQVMLNVLKNSLEAIDMEKEEKTIDAVMELNDQVITIKITDNGNGFDEQTAQKLFERGYTTKKSGTGLGLYNCRSIIESHSGTFNISSEGVGCGAVIEMTFVVG